MSRIGNSPVSFSEGTTVSLVDDIVIVFFESNAMFGIFNTQGFIYTLFKNEEYKSKRIHVHTDAHNLTETIRKLKNEKKKFLLIRNDSSIEAHNRAIYDLLLKNNLSLLTQEDVEYFYNPKLDKLSEVYHPKSWYDKGPIGESWFLRLLVIK